MADETNKERIAPHAAEESAAGAPLSHSGGPDAAGANAARSNSGGAISAGPISAGSESAAGELASQKGNHQQLAADQGQSAQERFLFSPPIDIFETEEGLVLQADLPGVSIKTLELQVQDNKLTLFGRVQPVVPTGARVLHQEYGVGDFLRSFILSDEVDHERITATMSNGVLKVVLPKAPQPKPRRIEVNAEPGS